MVRTRIFLLIIGSILMAGKTEATVKSKLKQYNVVWEEQSVGSKESMPLSGCNGYGANVWMEEGTLFLYLASNNSYDENGNLLKLGGVRVQMEPNLFDPASGFRQELDLYNSRITLSGKDKKGQTASYTLWIDPVYNGVHLEAKSSVPTKIMASFITWRDRDAVVNQDNWNRQGAETTKADLVETAGDKLVWYHRNQESDVLDKMLEKQNFTAYKDLIPDITRNRISGGLIIGKDLKYTGKEPFAADGWNGTAWNLATDISKKKHQIHMIMSSEQEPELSVWKDKLSGQAQQASASLEKLWQNHQDRWHTYWNRSYIFINLDKGASDPGFQVGRNYQLFRYMLACNEGNDLPLKFNGGIFTFDPLERKDCPNMPEEGGYFREGTPDFRGWGNLFMSQNQRLVGWPGLASGDYSLVEPSLLFYKDRLKVAEQRSRFYWGHAGAAFAEHLSLYGLPVNNLATATGESSAEHLKYHFSMQLEFAYMALLWAKYSGQNIDKYLPLVTSVVLFFEEHYKAEQKKRTGQEYDADGKLVLSPVNGLEIFKEAVNPVEVVAGLIAVTDELLACPVGSVPEETRSYFVGLSKRLPEVKYELRDGKSVIKPAYQYGKADNTWEFPEMYTVFPYNLIRLGKEDGLQEAINTWYNLPTDRRRALDFWSWQCTPAYAAMLGQTDEAKRLIIEKLSDKNANAKFPAFFGPGHDWIPDFNWGGSGMVALQRMLLNSGRDFTNLYSAWSADWDVSFRLFGYGGTVVESTFVNGKVERLLTVPRGLNINDFNGYRF